MYTPAGATQTQASPSLPLANAPLVVQPEVPPLKTRIDSLVDQAIRSFPLTSRKMGEISFLSDDEANTLIASIKSGRGFTYSEETHTYLENIVEITHSANDPLVSKTKLMTLRIHNIKAVVDFNKIRVLPNEPQPIISLKNMMSIGINSGGDKSLKAVEAAVQPGSWLRKMYDQSGQSDSENQQSALTAILPIVSKDGGAKALKAVELALKPNSWLRKIYDQVDQSGSENQQPALAAIFPIVSNDGCQGKLLIL